MEAGAVGLGQQWAVWHSGGMGRGRGGEGGRAVSASKQKTIRQCNEGQTKDKEVKHRQQVGHMMRQGHCAAHTDVSVCNSMQYVCTHSG